MYNVFKRPMFKRGGPTQGTGIMSHVEPRIKAQGGAFSQSGNTFLFGADDPNVPQTLFGFNIPGTQRAVNPDGTPVTIPTRNFAEDATFLLGPGKFLKAGGAGLNLIKAASKYGKFPAGYPSRAFEGVKNVGGDTLLPANMPKWYTNQGIIERFRPYLSGAGEITKQGAKGTVQLAKDYGIAAGGVGLGGAGIYSLLDKEDATNQVINQNAANAVNKSGAPDGRKDNTYQESDRRSKIAIEADEIMKVLKDEDMDKAQAFLLLSDALKQGGNLSDKINYAVKKAVPIAQQKAKDKETAKLLAYKTIAAREEPTTTEKTVSAAAKLAAKGDLTKEEQAKLAYYNSILEKETTAEKLSIADYFKIKDRKASLENSLLNLQKKIKDPKGDPKKYLSETEYQKYKRDYNDYMYIKEMEQKLGIKTYMADGGRIGYAKGTPTPEGDVIATETAGEGNAVPMQPVQKLTYEELRNRLPAEITNDIVQLIATSEQALQDFAYIRTQNDINNFNVKYGVNLVLPPQKG